MTTFARCVLRGPAQALLAATLLAAGCAGGGAKHAATPVDITGNAERLLVRDLTDPTLGRYLAEHGVATGPWPPPAWTLDALTAAAIYFDAGAAVARSRWRQAAAAEARAAQTRNPTLEPALGWDSDPDGDSPLTLGAAIAIPLAGERRRAARVALAQAETDAAAFDAMRRGWERRATVRHALIECHAAETRLAAITGQRRVYENIVIHYERRRMGGDVGISAVARARRDVEAIAGEQARQTGARTACRGKLAQALGVSASAAAGLALDTELLEGAGTLSAPAQSVRKSALTGRLDIRAGLSRHEAAEARLALEIARQRPEFTLEPGLFWDQGGLAWSLGSQVGLALWHNNEGAIAEAAAARDTAARAVLAVQEDVLTALAAADAALDAAQQRRAAAAAAAERAAARRSLAETLLARGETARLAVLEAELGVAAAARAETEAALAVLDAAAAYEDIVEQAIFGARDFNIAALALAEPGA